MSKLTLEQGSKEWKKWREWCTVPIPGKRSALYFLVTKVLGLEDKVPITPKSHYGMALFAERATGIPEIDSARVQLIQVARGFGKSAIVTNGRPLQQLLIDKNYSVGIANETQRMADKFLAQVRLTFEQNDLVRHLFPEVIPPDFRKTTWASSEIVIQRDRPRPVSPSILAVGVGGTVTGTHVDEWICDDLISKNAAMNAKKGLWTEIEGTNDWIVQLPPLLGSPERDPLTFIGTPWYEGDTYDFIERYFGDVPMDVELDKYPKDFEVDWVFTLPDGSTQTINLYRRGDIAVFRRPALDKGGKSIFPERWSTEELQKMATRPKTAEFFAANYLLKPASGLASLFKQDWLRRYEINGPGTAITYWDEGGLAHKVWIKDMLTIMSVDPAFADNQEGARTAIPVVGIYEDKVFLLEDWAQHAQSPQDISAKVAEFAQRYKPHTIALETIVAQRALLEPIRSALDAVRMGHVPIKEIPSHGKQSKMMRIYGLEPWFKSRKFFYHAEHSRFLREYTVFPKGALRDILDALSFQLPEWETALRIGSPDASILADADRAGAERARQALNANRWRKR